MRQAKTIDLSEAVNLLHLKPDNTIPSDNEIEKWFEIEQKKELDRDFKPQIDGIGKRFEDSSYYNFKFSNEDQKKLISECMEFATNDKSNLILNGTVGTGKTHIAISVMKMLPKRYVGSYISNYGNKNKAIKTYRKSRGLFLSFYDFIDELEDARNMGLKAHRIETYLAYDCICLDDLRLEDISLSVKRNLFSLINGVYEAKKKFILTTNASFKDIEQWDLRISDRLRENGMAKAFTWESFRSKK